MCRRVQCNSCGKPTFAGCGAHIEQVLGDVPKADRCRCREAGQSAKPQGDAGNTGNSFLGRLFGR
jgi:hypothetical protein